ncbi:hypothetical protein O6H91_19G045700 [Diphasiastrum complanatum]|uniref:Uncharacterized protein n=1 Tax=Diphasiastrum complanatum TaxID=34168 RepID=A0ACC2AUR4_DIPCM|nr:hypothetical protein O6H91_19G045700 [Diphasiastrum complanatum]
MASAGTPPYITSLSRTLSHPPTPTPTPTPTPPSHDQQQRGPQIMDSSDQLSAQGELPLIDLRLLCHADEAEIQKLVVAAKEWGFLQVANHGVPCKLLSKVEEQACRAFALPVEAKTRAKPAAGSFHGYIFPKSSKEDGKGLPLSEAIRLPLNPEHRAEMIFKFWPEGDEAFRWILRLLNLQLGIPRSCIVC